MANLKQIADRESMKNRGGLLVADVAILDHAHALIEAVRAWANADCGATEAERVLKKLAEYDEVAA